MSTDLYSVKLRLSPEGFERKRDALSLLRQFILPPSMIVQVKSGYVATWQIWPPVQKNRMYQVAPTLLPSGVELWDPDYGARHETLMLAEYPWVSYNFEDVVNAIKAPIPIVDRVMTLGGSTDGPKPKRIDFFADLTLALRREAGLSRQAYTRVWEYMPCGKPSNSPPYPEYLLNIHPPPAEVAHRFLRDVIEAVWVGEPNFHFARDGRVLWLHIPSAKEWWEEGMGWVLRDSKLWEGLRAFPNLLTEGRRQLRFNGRKLLCNGIDLAEWSAMGRTTF